MLRRLATTLRQIGAGAASLLEQGALAIPPVRRRVQHEYDRLMAGLEPAVKPYSRELPATTRLPAEGRDREQVLAEMAALAAREEGHWREGFVSGAVYHGDSVHIDFLNRAYAISSQSNPLHVDLWPSATKYEAEIVAMTAAMLGGGEAGAAPE
ncbi:MAG: aspartate aminotransferase family protein, partial [Chloroflexales bacterium]|nr:aspartate aminotransferase family protein [Chloroflexales bacterium]